MKRLTQTGFSHIVVLVALVGVFAVVGFAGYTVMNAQTDTADTPTTSKAAVEQKAIDTTPQLKEADQTLTDVNTQLSSDLDTSSLDEDIQNLY